MDPRECTTLKVQISILIEGDVSKAKEVAKELSPHLSAIIGDAPKVLSAVATLEAAATTPKDLIDHLLVNSAADAHMSGIGQLMDLTPGRERRN